MLNRRTLQARRFAILLLLSATPAWAGFCSPDSSPSEPRHDFQFFAGYSPVSATLIGTTTDRRFFLAGFGYSYHCWNWPGVSVSYSGELINVTGGGVRIEAGHTFLPHLQRHEIRSSEIRLGAPPGCA